ncbi:MAG: GNAT family N-acetyltransferase [Gammaproteobacteria bacterium]|nr:GNAT family N-acetyltransferase [Gammaproteobacteria bacterium]
MTPCITFRPIRDEDQAFLCRVYASTRQEELALTDWDEARKKTFLSMQFDIQHKSYQEQYGDAEFLIILKDQEPVGRLYLDRQTHEEIRLIDIALLPEHCNNGIGTSLLTGIMADAEKLGKPIRIYVEQYNRALRLYNRLGFTKMGESGIYFMMKWFPVKNGNKKIQENGK